MDSKEFIGVYDTKKRNSYLAEFERLGRSRFPKIDSLASEVERRGAFFGEVVEFVVDSAVMHKETEQIDPSVEEAVLEQILPQMHDYFSWVEETSVPMLHQINEWSTQYGEAADSHIARKIVEPYGNLHCLAVCGAREPTRNRISWQWS